MPLAELLCFAVSGPGLKAVYRSLTTLFRKENMRNCMYYRSDKVTKGPRRLLQLGPRDVISSQMALDKKTACVRSLERSAYREASPYRLPMHGVKQFV